MKAGHLFNGIGGFPLAASWMGWENVFHSEIELYPNKIMKQWFPNSIEHGDIRTTGFEVYRGRIDVLTGGDPCQGNSYAGLQEGKGYKGYLWPEMHRVIGEILPAWIVNENVPGSITNGVLDQKIDDLESLDYSWWPPLVIPASAVGALHRRDRVWLVAHSERNVQPRQESCDRQIRRMGGASNPWRGTPTGKVKSPSFEEWMMGYPITWTVLTV